MADFRKLTILHSNDIHGDFLAEQVEKGTVFLIQPKVKSDVGRIEKNRDKLKALYEEGYRDGQDCYDDLLAFLKK